MKFILVKETVNILLNKLLKKGFLLKFKMVVENYKLNRLKYTSFMDLLEKLKFYQSTKFIKRLIKY